ncbi:Hpt domain-containing protein [Pontiella sulfatireligans]|uniref:HPt domain-containing protein n=1 Tax=Pontiella sulfatireligans TaxID=2750658 RepID=A0A6C2ULZ8_9BACT|nr:Hpt domain-containing protein [Pontiella sulfatireligans]VGO21285.1 hypothetical protein SCARR_03357 [Pontiella sulfatireligans]
MCNEDVIDPTVLLDAISGDTALATELLELFFCETNKDFEGLCAAVAAASVADAVKAAHKMAGASMACGLAGVAGELRELEQLCKVAMPSDMNARVSRAGKALSDARHFFENYYAKEFSA